MARREYAFPARFKWRLWENIGMMAILPIFVLILGILGLDAITTAGLVLFLAVGAAFIAWGNWWIFRNWAERVIVDEEGIEVQPFYGKRISMRWDDIGVRQEFHARDSFKGMIPHARLIGGEPPLRIVLSGDMPAFDELLQDVRLRTPQASPGPERRWWERIFLPG